MAIMVPSGFFQNRTDHHANTHRLAYSTLLRPSIYQSNANLTGGGGVHFAPTCLKVLAQASPNMSVRLSRGTGNITGQESNTQGNYVIANDTEITPIAVGASHATLQRIDMVYIYANDSVYSGALNKVDFGYITGVNAAVGSAVPLFASLPPNAELLCEIVVNPGVTSITQSVILDFRTFYTCQGGVRITRPFSITDAGIDYGDLRYYNGRIEGWNAEATTGWRPVAVDNVQYVTTGWTYSFTTVNYTIGTVSIPDPGYPYYIEGEFSANTNLDNSTTRWDIVARLDTTGGTILGNGIAAREEQHRTRTPWLRSAVLTGAHSVVMRFEKVSGANAAVGGDGVAYIRVVPQPCAANAGVLVNV